LVSVSLTEADFSPEQAHKAQRKEAVAILVERAIKYMALSGSGTRTEVY
jgi:hypothetical protein